MDRSVAAVAVVLVLATAAVPPAAANTLVVGEPEVSVSSPTGPVQASQSTAVTVVVSNAGDLEQGDPEKPGYERQVTTARNVRVRLQEGGVDAPIQVQTGTRTLGSLPTGEAVPLKFDLEVGRAKPGTYRIPVVVEYDYTRAINYDRFEQPEFTETTEEVRTTVTLRVESRPQFEVTSGGTDGLFAGDSGTLEFTLRNVGSRTATNATVALTSGASGVAFGSAANPQRSTSLYVDSLAPGESRTLSAKVRAGADVSPGSYPVEAVVTYENRNGVTQRADPLTVGVTVRPDRRFALRDLRTERFRVDESEARIRARIVNTGDAPARNVVVALEGSSPVAATNGESAVGDLAPGEAKPVSFTVDIAGDAEPGTNSFRFGVEYENADGEVLTADDPIRKAIAIGPEQNPFEVVDVATTVTPGGSARLDVRVRYAGAEPVSAVNAKLFTSDPITSSDDGAYLGRIEPGETATASFQVSAGGSALVKEYDASIELRYDEADGDTKFTDGLPVGVPVSEPSGGPPLIPIAVGSLVVLAAAGYVVANRV
ncbi:MAG: COG1361 S-layer family protein [Haloferacaceae archaeon]